MGIRKGLSTQEKLTILSAGSQYDLACACGTPDSEHRRRSAEGMWIYPVVRPDGQKGNLFKTLVSNVCVNDCKYCPLRAGQDPRRCTLEPDKLIEVFRDYYRAGRVFGLFLTSGVVGDADRTMERLNGIALRLRKMQFKGYLHLKVIPGASRAAIEEAVSLASAVSVNIETAGQKHFQQLCGNKDYLADVIEPIKLISRLTEKGSRYQRVKQTTQFVVGAAEEKDQEIVKYSWGLYKRLGLSRVYFSAYQRGLGAADLPGEHSVRTNDECLTREHRLYQVDWLIRKYGFGDEEIPFEQDGNLSLTVDPKEQWARRHGEFFPVNVNRADRYALLRVPGLGLITVDRILTRRKAGDRIRNLGDLGKAGKLLRKAQPYIRFT